MQLIDANVILRYILNDNKEQYDKAVLVIAEGAFTLPEILAEVVYVLKGVYNTEKSEVCDSLLKVLELVHIENKSAMVEAIKVYRDTSLDFVDCILIGRNRILGNKVFIFDEKLNKRLQ